MRLIGLPSGSSHLNAIEGAWRQARRALPVSEHHPTIGGDADGGVTALQAHGVYRLDVMSHLARTSLKAGTDS